MRRLVLLLPVLALIIAITPVSLAGNAVVGTGSAGSCTQSALQGAVTTVNNGGGTITFNCGGSPHTIVLMQQLRFDTQGASYTLDGANLITLDGNLTTRLIYTASGLNLSLTVKDIRLVNGRAISDAPGERAANQGGAICSGYNNSLTVQHVHFENNSAQAERHPYHGGGAIAIDTTSVVTITDSTFIDNRAPNGGAINNLLSRLTIERSLFSDNRATRDDPGGGGAIYNDAGKVTIKDTHILNNVSANLGGGIFSWAHNVNGTYSGKTLIKNSVLDGNSAEHGGGLWKGGYYVLELRNSSVTNNTATNGGAGISGTGPGKNFKIVNSTIAYNATFPDGTAGGIFSSGAPSTIMNSTIAFNTIPDDTVGAAIHGDVVTVTNTIFLGNTGGWNGIWSCQGNIVNGGHNLQSPGDTCGGGIPTQNAQLEAILQPALNTLAFGETQTLMLLPGSPAINGGANCPAADQRGIVRPQGDYCDIGALEKEGTAPAIPLITSPVNNATGVPLQPMFSWGSSPGADDYKVTILNAAGDLVYKVIVPGGCSPTCSYDYALSGKSLKPGKSYKLIVQARNDFGKRKGKAKFTTA